MMILPKSQSQTTHALLARLVADLRDYRFPCEYAPHTGVVLVGADSGKWYAVRWSPINGAYYAVGVDDMLYGTNAVVEFLEDN